MMDSKSPKGLIALKDSNRMLDALRQLYSSNVTSIEIFITNPDEYAHVDGIIVENNIITAIFEQKCRYKMDRNQLRYLFNNELLVDYVKIQALLNSSSNFCVPSYFLNYLVDEENKPNCFMTQFTDKYGNPLIEYKVEKRLCKKTINSTEKVLKDIALIPIKDSFEFTTVR